MSSTSTGKDAESIVADTLSEDGHTILSRNWRTRWCEIDIVSVKSDVVYFTEVKYRQNDVYGSGFDYIHYTKQKQMTFAAEFWIASHSWRGDARLLGAEVDKAGSIKIVEL